jgi:hypothetical protein
VKKDLKKKEKKEVYQKPEIKSETVEISVYGNYGATGPIPQAQPMAGLCCP